MQIGRMLKRAKICLEAACWQHLSKQTTCKRGVDLCWTSATPTQSYLQHDMHFPRGLQPLIFRPSKGVRCCQHNVQHHPTGPDVCNLQVTDKQLKEPASGCAPKDALAAVTAVQALCATWHTCEEPVQPASAAATAVC